MQQAVIHAGEDEDWLGECLSLPGRMSRGRAKEEAIENIREAVEGYILALTEDKLPVPEERFGTLVVAV